MPAFSQLSSNQLREALQLSEQIEQLQQQLGSIIGGSEGGGISGSTDTKRQGSKAGGNRKAGTASGGKSGMSAQTRARIAAAAKARWAKQKGGDIADSGDKATAIPSSVGAPGGGKSRRRLSLEARKKIAERENGGSRKGRGNKETKTPSKAIALPKPGGGLSPEGRARLAAAMRARWTQRKQEAGAGSKK